MTVVRRRLAELLVLLGLLLLLAAAALWIIPSNEYIFLPDVAHPVAPLVSIPGRAEPKRPGGIYFVDVVVRKATLLERLIPGLRQGADVVPANDGGSLCAPFSNPAVGPAGPCAPVSPFSP